MRSLSLVRMPCFRRCSMISTTSPNHEGVEGTECEEVWMMTEESAILVMCTSLLGKMCILPQERHILCLLATNYISLRNSWAKHVQGRVGWAAIVGRIVVPTSSPPTKRFHIIHPVVVYQKKISPGFRSRLSPTLLRCSRTIPPCPCTMAFGKPVVPEE